MVLSGVDAALARWAEDLLAGIPGSNPAEGIPPHLRGLIQDLKEVSRQILPGQDTSTDFGPSNFAGFVDALDGIENLLVTPLSLGPLLRKPGEKIPAGSNFSIRTDFVSV